MKNFRRFCFALLLVAAFTIPVFADGGETQGPGLTAPGDMHTPGVAAPGDMQGPGLTMAAILLAIQIAV